MNKQTMEQHYFLCVSGLLSLPVDATALADDRIFLSVPPFASWSLSFFCLPSVSLHPSQVTAYASANIGVNLIGWRRRWTLQDKKGCDQWSGKSKTSRVNEQARKTTGWTRGFGCNLYVTKKVSTPQSSPDNFRRSTVKKMLNRRLLQHNWFTLG